MKNPYEKHLMANPYGPLKVEETNEKSITSKNMLRNRKKELKEKEIKYKKTNCDKLKEKIDKLLISIWEYENYNTVVKKKKKKKNKKKNKKGLLNDDDYFLNNEIKKMNLLEVKEEIRIKRINRLWRKILLNNKYKNNVWNRIRYFDIPYWSYNKHGLFPLHMRRVIVSLFCFHNRNNTLFSILPRSILIDLLELNMRWIDCGKDTNPRENQVIIPYSTGKGEKMVYHIRWYGEWVCFNKN